ncbi:unnamed protein product [Triticum turgidum subsp. durum]|uniref:AT-hook motif nuclear-localized protein n=1 Tax=Triticum turgidum subsp. durum TaxID=4567 RepID=A0A9R0TS45_TRITD|nr:unnamed protein product [Triticum turgidum subsp. durum]
MMEVRASQEQQGGMAGREPFGLPSSPPTPQSSGPVPNMRMTYGEDGNAYFLKPGSAPPPAEAYQPGGGAGLDMPAGPDAAAAGGNGGPAFELNMEEEAAKKRGRAMKYGDDGNTSLALVPVPMPEEPTAVAPGGSGAFPQPAVKPAAGGVLAVPPAGMKKRGRPKGSTNKVKKQDKVMSALAFIGTAGAGFTPHVIAVQAGEDVAAKILSFAQHGVRAVVVLSANGAISNVTLRQSATSGGTVTYEGRFEILSLSGSFTVQETGGHRSRTGGLSVSLASPDGRVLGGGIAGLLIACTPIQVVVGTFNTVAEKKKAPKHQAAAAAHEPASAPPRMTPSFVPAPIAVPPLAPAPISVGMAQNSPPSRGTLSESSGSPMNQGVPAAATPSNSGLSSMPWK